MKTNLDSKFKLDSSSIEDGVWYELAEDVGFRVRPFNSSNVKMKQAHDKYFKPHAKTIQLGGMSQEKIDDISIRVFVDACMVDWKGVEIDGEVKPYSPELAIELFKTLPDLLNTLLSCAEDKDNYREVLGNL